MDLYEDGEIDQAGKGSVVGPIISTCESKWYTKDGLKDEADLTGLNYEDVGYLPGKIVWLLDLLILRINLVLHYSS